MAAQFNGRNGTETLICDVIVVFNTAAFLRQWVVRGEGFRSKCKSNFNFGKGWGVRLLFGEHYSLDFRRSNVSLLPQVSVQIVGAASCFNASRRGLKEIPNKLLTVRVCSKLSSAKSSAQTRECFKGVKQSLFISIRHFLLSFGSWVNLKVLTLDCEVFVQLIATQNTLVFLWNSLWT